MSKGTEIVGAQLSGLTVHRPDRLAATIDCAIAEAVRESEEVAALQLTVAELRSVTTLAFDCYAWGQAGLISPEQTAAYHKHAQEVAEMAAQVLAGVPCAVAFQDAEHERECAAVRAERDTVSGQVLALWDQRADLIAALRAAVPKICPRCAAGFRICKSDPNFHAVFNEYSREIGCSDCESAIERAILTRIDAAQGEG